MDLKSHIEEAKANAARASADILNTLSFVPDDRLAYSPSPTSRSALWLVGHCAQANHAFSTGIRRIPMPMPSERAAFAEMIRNAGRETQSREEAVRGMEASTAEVLAALDTLTPEGMEHAIRTPFGEMPMAFWMTLPGLHTMGHARQLDYLQTVWGDIEDHTVAP